MPHKKTANSTEIFTQTVNDYIKYRPTYPHKVLEVLINECGLTKDSIIADVGSGTGILSKLFLDHGNLVYGVEPNQAMREAAEDYLKNYSNFRSIAGSAEATLFENHSVDIITAGTAFHWFNAIHAKQEFKRILKAPGWVMLIWNVRNCEQSDLLKEYENLILTYGKGYRETNAITFDKTLDETFFSPFKMNFKSFNTTQQFDWEGLKGRLLSTSYSLRPEDVGYEMMLQRLKEIFDQYQRDGLVEFLYDTKLYYGHLHHLD